MNTEAFFEHWGIRENPFRAEEARDDPVLVRLMESGANHPEFEKIFGDPSHPHASVVFGEKGSGKTALRLLMENRIGKHNAKNPEERTWVVKYDDLNPALDRFLHKMERMKSKDGLDAFRLEDHIDVIISSAVTNLVDQLLHESDAGDVSARKMRRKIRWMSKQKRIDLAELCVLYDQPQSGTAESRWSRMRRRVLRTGLISLPTLALSLGWLMLLLTIGIGGYIFFKKISDAMAYTALGVAGLSTLGLFVCWAIQSVRYSKLARKLLREVHVVDRQQHQLKTMISHIDWRDLMSQPLPVPGEQDSRYQLMRRLIQIMTQIGYKNIIVLFDRVDEPTVIKGDAAKMKSVVWPMFDNKFLQQENFGVKLLLPIELRHLLNKEDAAFYQKARLDKQHMVDRLQWSGATLYDLCNVRLAACASNKDEIVSLRTIFADDVSEQDIIDALGQMEQPRDAFKFVYQVILEHCRNSPDQNPQWEVPKLTLDYVRREQSQRIRDLHRGLGPA